VPERTLASALTDRSENFVGHSVTPCPLSRCPQGTTLGGAANWGEPYDHPGSVTAIASPLGLRLGSENFHGAARQLILAATDRAHWSPPPVGLLKPAVRGLWPWGRGWRMTLTSESDHLAARSRRTQRGGPQASVVPGGPPPDQIASRDGALAAWRRGPDPSPQERANRPVRTHPLLLVRSPRAQRASWRLQPRLAQG
jgi:hypothetical protein